MTCRTSGRRPLPYPVPLRLVTPRVQHITRRRWVSYRRSLLRMRRAVCRFLQFIATEHLTDAGVLWFSYLAAVFVFIAYLLGFFEAAGVIN